MGGEEPGLLLRRADPRRAARREGRLSPGRRFPLDGAVVPGLLLLLARDLALHDPLRVLAWRLSHDAHLAESAGALAALLPSATGALDRDPLAQALAGAAVLCALGYAALAALGARPAIRALTIAIAALLLVVGPSLAFVAIGAAADRPYGQDGGVVQLPLAIDKILSGQSPYGADYSGTILEKQARVSSFWDEWGGNPILHHHAYLPGTHLLMAPFQLASRAVFGFFDPRFVTLLFYALAVVLAASVPRESPARLAAAGVVALNPLVYWHQIFGANDVVFVALLLGVVLLARREQRVAAAALLGLACATKQLAWPFAPFLLLALSGARSFRELLSMALWKRLLAPAAVLVAVFLAVVVPVAALDFRAFWGDIVVYNVGLPGGDNYPLGGTPGFGFANFLIYFGRVASLRDYFPFSVFYLLLAPLGLLLVRSQLKDGRLEWALATGSAALIASLYFSRVVHPNYLIPAAILLPLAMLSLGRAADLALAPLLLLAVAVEIAENALFRTTWEQAATASLPQRLGGLFAALAPGCGPQLSVDPLGLLFSALAAGFALVVLVAGVLFAGPRLRVLLLAAAGATLALPVLTLLVVSDRTGLVRAQDPAVVQAIADAGRLTAGHSPYALPPETAPRGREMVSSSFRLDPPAEITPERPLMPPGAAILALATRLVGLRDLRWLLLAASATVGMLLMRPLAGEEKAGALAVAVLLPPLALGASFGSPFVLALAPILGVWLARRGGRPLVAGALAGVAIAMDHRALWVALLLLLLPYAAEGTARAAGHGARVAPHPGTPPASPSDERRLRSTLLRRLGELAAAAAAYLVLVLPVAWLDLAAFAARWAIDGPAIGPGLGLVNLLAYRGLEASPVAVGVVAWAPLVLSLIVVVMVAGQHIAALPAAAVVSLAAIALAPAITADVVAIPIVLLAAAAFESAPQPTTASADPAHSTLP